MEPATLEGTNAFLVIFNEVKEARGMHPQWPPAWGPRMRQASGLSPGRRRLAHVERDQLLATLEAMDNAADEATRARVEVVARLVELRERLWPELVGCRARRPPPHDQRGLPPVPAGAIFVSGRVLRAACPRLLRHLGRRPFPGSQGHPPLANLSLVRPAMGSGSAWPTTDDGGVLHRRLPEGVPAE